eukprot:CAMPEP_0119092640 /NCGR_PEP_ID=MMETSP1178-20130426/160399_1 /TAXON_ID=33656 /ORGANISM="unid sp, Strain CCMP2000" /LENGTH=39 /DNA_ID= /DNA_START= /DNA_END= /DNA_ORIENTATION=
MTLRPPQAVLHNGQVWDKSLKGCPVQEEACRRPFTNYVS